MNKKFMNHQGDPIENVAEYIKNWKAKKSEYAYKIYVGCDSQVNKKNTIYSIVIAIHKVGKGAHLIHTREHKKKLPETTNGIINRLWGEIERVVEMALYLKENGINIDDIGTHIDINADKKYISNKIYKSAIGWLNGLGFKVEGKPSAWCSTYCANKYCR